MARCIAQLIFLVLLRVDFGIAIVTAQSGTFSSDASVRTSSSTSSTLVPSSTSSPLNVASSATYSTHAPSSLSTSVGITSSISSASPSSSASSSPRSSSLSSSSVSRSSSSLTSSESKSLLATGSSSISLTSLTYSSRNETVSRSGSQTLFSSSQSIVNNKTLATMSFSDDPHFNDSLFQCNLEWLYWRRSSYAALGAPAPTPLASYEIELYSTVWATICGTLAKIVDVVTTGTSTHFDSEAYYHPASLTPWSATPFSKSTPTCLFNETGCQQIYDWWVDSSKSSKFVESSSWNPQCSDHVTGCGKCTIGGGTVKLLYWALPTTVPRDMCATAPVNTPLYYADFPSGAPIPSVETLGTTLYANKAYISYSLLAAVNYCSKKVIGSVHQAAFLEVESRQLQSLRRDGRSFPFNFADLNTPYPWSALAGNNYFCAKGECPTTMDGRYLSPWLVVPDHIRAMDPAWAECDLKLGGAWDPPHALGTAAVVTTADAPAVEQTSPPTPKDVPQAPAVQTPAPDATPAAGRTDGADQRPDGADQRPEDPSKTDGGNNGDPGSGKPSQNETPPPNVLSPGVVIPVGSESATVNSEGNVIVGDSTMAPGQQFTVGDAVLSVGSYNAVVQGPSGAQTWAPEPQAVAMTEIVATVGGQAQTYTAINAGGNVVVGTQVISIGGPPVTMPDGAVLSYGSNGLVMNDATVGFGGQSGEPALASIYHDPGSPNTVVVGSITLSAGGPVATIGGQVISVAPGGFVVVDGSVTVPLNALPTQPPATRLPTNIGAIILSGFGFTGTGKIASATESTSHATSSGEESASSGARTTAAARVTSTGQGGATTSSKKKSAALGRAAALARYSFMPMILGELLMAYSGFLSI